jgi:hypothetical protein
MADKYSRTNFFDKNNIDGILENDLISNNFNQTRFERAKTFYTVKSQDIQRPELLANKNYSKPNLWWFTMKFNNIDDIWNDMEPNDSLTLLNEMDIEDYYKDFRKKK